MKSRSESRFPCRGKEQNFRTYFSPISGMSPKPTFELLMATLFFRGFLALRLTRHVTSREPNNMDQRKPTHGHCPRPKLETDLASRWEGVRLPRASGKSPDFPRSFPELPRKFFGHLPGGSLTVELYSNPEVPGSFPDFPGSFPDFPGGQPLSLGSLTPSPDSQKLSLTRKNFP